MEGVVFRGRGINPKLLSDLDLIIESDLGFGLRGRFEAVAILGLLKEVEGGCYRLCVTHPKLLIDLDFGHYHPHTRPRRSS